MKLRATVKEPSGKTKHSVGQFVAGRAVPGSSLPVPTSVVISEEGGAFYLLHLNEQGVCFADTWHQTLDDAKRQAEYEFGISPAEWTPHD